MAHHSTEAAVNNSEEREHCPRCGSNRTNRNGTRYGKQIYLCRNCWKQWRPGPALGKHRFPPEQIGFAIRVYYSGLSFRRTAESVMDKFNIKDTDVSPQTIRHWVRKYTDAAEREFRELKAPGGGTWWLFNQPFHLHHRMWWIVVDDATGFVLVSQVGSSASEDVAVDVIIEALASTVLPCDELVYRMVGTDLHGSRRSNGSDAVLRVIKDKLPDNTVIRDAGTADGPVLGQIVNNVLHECVTASKRFARIRSEAELQRYLNGWVLNRNLFTTREELGGMTPACAAGVEIPFEDWADVVSLEANERVPRNRAGKCRLGRGIWAVKPT